MITPVNFDIAKLLKEKGFDIPTQDCYNLNGLLFSNGWCEYIADDYEFDGLVYPNKLKEKDVLAPTIAEVVMWLYDKHGVWIECFIDDDKTFGYLISKISEEGRLDFPIKGNFVTPARACEAAFDYTLKNLI